LLEQRLDVTETGQGTAVTLHDGKFSPDWVKQSGAEAVAKSLGVDTSAPGLVSWDVFDHLMTPGDVIAVVTWRDHAAVEAFEREGNGGCIALAQYPHCPGVRNVRSPGSTAIL
jgi:hypothetical protein